MLEHRGSSLLQYQYDITYHLWHFLIKLNMSESWAFHWEGSGWQRLANDER